MGSHSSSVHFDRGDANPEDSSSVDEKTQLLSLEQGGTGLGPSGSPDLAFWSRKITLHPDHPVSLLSEYRPTMDDVDAATKADCVAQVVAMFPDICGDYLAETAAALGYDALSVSTHIVDQSEAGKPYPKRPKLKRKREDPEPQDPVSEALRKYGKPEEREELKSDAYARKS